MIALGHSLLAHPLALALFAHPDDGGSLVGWVVGRILLVLLIVHVILIMAALMVWAERRVSAWMQDRLGPNRVGPEGLLQPLADLGKFMFKEDVIPGHVNKWMYTLAPLIIVVPALITFAVIPYTGNYQGEELRVFPTDSKALAAYLETGRIEDVVVEKEAGPDERTVRTATESSAEAYIRDLKLTPPVGEWVAGTTADAERFGGRTVYRKGDAVVVFESGGSSLERFREDKGPYEDIARSGWTVSVSDGYWRSWQIADLNIGVLYILAITGLGVYGITLGGWASNSKYSLLGGVRAAAQMISYELSLGLAVVPTVLLAASLHLGNLVDHQAQTTWFLFQQPIAALIFLISSYAETNRLPFDMPESETELVAGYHTEYSSMKFALFFMGEYVNMIVASALMVTLFLGGWTFFGVEKLGWFVGVLIFATKTLFLLFVFIWVRWTIPRFRYDQLMRLGWGWLLPIALVNIILTGAAKVFDQTWIMYLLPAALVAFVLVLVWFAWRRSAGDIPKLQPYRPGDMQAAGGREGTA